MNLWAIEFLKRCEFTLYIFLYCNSIWVNYFEIKFSGRHRAQGTFNPSPTSSDERKNVTFPGGMEALWGKGSIAPVCSTFWITLQYTFYFINSAFNYHLIWVIVNNQKIILHPSNLFHERKIFFSIITREKNQVI